MPHLHDPRWTLNVAESTYPLSGLTRRRPAPRASIPDLHDRSRMPNAAESTRSGPGLTRPRRTVRVPIPHDPWQTPITAEAARPWPGLTRRRRPRMGGLGCTGRPERVTVVDMARMLVERGADVSAQDKDDGYWTGGLRSMCVQRWSCGCHTHTSARRSTSIRATSIRPLLDAQCNGVH